MAYRFVHGHLRREWMFTLLKPFTKRRQTELIKILHGYTENVIKERRNELANNKEKVNEITI